MAKAENEGEVEAGKAAGEANSTGQGQAAKPDQASGQPSNQTSQRGDAISLLKADHRAVETMFAAYKSAQDAQKPQLIGQICTALTIHTILEEEIFYPACREAASDEDPLDEAQVEHDSAKMLIASLMQARDDDRFRDAKVSVLAEQIKHHVGEEEAPSSGIFAKAQAAGVNTPEMARKLQARKQELEARADRLAPPRAVSLDGRHQVSTWSKEEDMPRQSSPGRDERGRFTGDDDRDGRQRARYDDDDRRYARSRDDDDGRGWYGDSQGHSEASRRGWAERRGERRSFSSRYEDDRGYGSGGSDNRDRDEYGRFTSDDGDRGGYRSQGREGGDDRRYGSRGSNDRDRDEYGRFASDDDRGGGSYSRSRDDDDDRQYRSRGSSDRGRDENGRFTSDDDDRRGGSRARGRDDDDGRGWYGDSRGHAEAARRGWEHRDGGSRTRSRDDDDDDRRGRSSSTQGGWFGDSRGHAEAARRGWESRR